LLAEPFFWPKALCIDSPKELSRHTQQGTGFEADEGVGKEIWNSVAERLKTTSPAVSDTSTATVAAINSGGHGKPQIVLPRLGQGSFRALLTDVYGRRCAVTGERTLPVLDAAHIKPYKVFPRHELSNGLLLRSDLHRLFDDGYITVDPVSRRIVVSKRIREEFENGKDYYRLEGTTLREPIESIHRPHADNLEYHASHVFR
jgi:putative restriction endonuclease